MSWEAPTGQIARPAPQLMAGVAPAPTAEEAAAIVAAVEVLWPRPALAAAAEDVRRPAWRFSGRWWSKPVQSRRARPGR